MEYSIKIMDDTNIGCLARLAKEAKLEGFNFVQRTIDEWGEGINRFSGHGEILWGVFDDGQCIGIGGLNIDPYANDPKVGRVRHVYVSKSYRKRGVASEILDMVIKRSKDSFKILRVSTHKPGQTNPEADKFYEYIGFKKDEGEKQTHRLKLV
jgi:GNAT superfamily N-acetyltransferase